MSGTKRREELAERVANGVWMQMNGRFRAAMAPVLVRDRTGHQSSQLHGIATERKHARILLHNFHLVHVQLWFNSASTSNHHGICTGCPVYTIVTQPVEHRDFGRIYGRIERSTTLCRLSHGPQEA